MNYYISRIIDLPFDKAIEKVTETLKTEGFGILTEIDVAATLKKKIDVDFKPYVILGACNPPLAHKVLSSEDKIGVMLPCNVVVIQQENGVEVAAIDPAAAMEPIQNDTIKPIAEEVRVRLKRVIDTLA